MTRKDRIITEVTALYCAVCIVAALLAHHWAVSISVGFAMTVGACYIQYYGDE